MTSACSTACLVLSVTNPISPGPAPAKMHLPIFGINLSIQNLGGIQRRLGGYGNRALAQLHRLCEKDGSQRHCIALYSSIDADRHTAAAANQTKKFSLCANAIPGNGII